MCEVVPAQERILIHNSGIVVRGGYQTRLPHTSVMIACDTTAAGFTLSCWPCVKLDKARAVDAGVRWWWWWWGRVVGSVVVVGVGVEVNM